MSFHSKTIIVFLQCMILALTLVAAIHQAYASEQPSRVLESTLELNDVRKRIDITGSVHSTGFFVPGPSEDLLDFIYYKSYQSEKPVGTNKPNFLESPRYWISIDIINRTDQQNWNLHVSNFFLETVTLIASDGVEQQIAVSNFFLGQQSESINPLGRSFPISLQKNVPYSLALELTASKKVWPPYIGIMSASYYKSWSSQLNYLYLIPIGVILGFVVIALICFFLLFDKTFLWFSISSFLLLVFNLQLGSPRIELLNAGYEFSSWLFVLASLTIISLLLFAFDFLRIQQTRGFLYQSFVTLIGISSIILVLSFFLSDYVKTVLYSLNAALMIILICSSGIIKVVNGEKYYLIYILGWTPLLISLFEFSVHVLTGHKSEEITISYKLIRELYVQIFHMLIHAVAIYHRVRALKKQKLEAELANRAKSWIMATSSHDLKQPLHAMAMHLSLVKDHVSSPVAKEMINSLDNSLSAMNSTFQSIMDLNQIEAGVVPVNSKVFSLNTLLEKLRDSYTQQAQAKKLQMKVLPTKLLTKSDPLLLERILLNLVTNSIRYTAKGKILIGCRRRRNMISIQIWDTGCGFEKEEMTTLFDLYKRSHKTRREVNGMGIGLSIVKNLSDLLGHKIDVTSEPGKGTVFKIEVPLICGKETTDNESHENIEDKLNIALIASEPSLKTSSSKLFSRWGYKYFSYSSICELRKMSDNFRARLDFLFIDQGNFDLIA